MTEEERRKREEEWSRQEAGRRSANLEWNRAALAAENEEMDKHLHDPRLPEPWTMADIADERDKARGSDWKLAARWPWVDAIAWVALRDPEVMSVLSACRSMFGRDAESDTTERKCWAVLKTRVDRLSLEDAERQLRAWCRAGLAPVDGSGAPVTLPTDRLPYDVMLSAADVQRMAPAIVAASVADPPSVVPREEWEAEGKRVAALLDDEGFSVRDVRQSHVSERWNAAKGKVIAVTTVTGWMKGKPKTGRPAKSV